jgi:ABC-type bacteriocin/lantibiotic exporter with double-glycine peptidase domain
MIRLQNITWHTEGPLLFEHFNLQVEQGQKVVVQGPSGSGKTTLLNMIMGFVRPQEGDIFIDRHPLNARNVPVLRRKITWLPQTMPVTKGQVIKQVQLPFQFKYNKGQKPQQVEINKQLQAMNLSEDILEKDMSQISGGERQRIGLLICLLLDRPIFLLDEPTNHLDKVVKEEVSRLVLQDKERTVLSTSHDPDWIKHCDKTIKL